MLVTQQHALLYNSIIILYNNSIIIRYNNRHNTCVYHLCDELRIYVRNLKPEATISAKHNYFALSHAVDQAHVTHTVTGSLSAS